MTRGRRADHSRLELVEIILTEGAALISEKGYASFSTREISRRIGYSVGMVLNVMGSTDNLICSINTRTFSMWADFLEKKLQEDDGDPVAVLVRAYFRFAEKHRNLWSAIFEHKPLSMVIPDDQAQERGRLTAIVIREVERVLDVSRKHMAQQLAHSFIATVHGHCTYTLSGSFQLLGESDPEGAALNRIRDSLEIERQKAENPGLAK